MNRDDVGLRHQCVHVDPMTAMLFDRCRMYEWIVREDANIETAELVREQLRNAAKSDQADGLPTQVKLRESERAIPDPGPDRAVMYWYPTQNREQESDRVVGHRIAEP